MKARKLRKAYRKWLVARALVRLPLPARVRRMVEKRIAKYSFARNYMRFYSASDFLLARKPGRKYVFLDVTRSIRDRRNYGITRVISQLAKALLNRADHEFDVELVYWNQHFEEWCVAAEYGAALSPNSCRRDGLVHFQPGDIFLALDLNFALADESVLRKLTSANARIMAVVYDLIPLHRPDCFNQDAVEKFRAWATAMFTNASDLICISKAVASDVANSVEQLPLRNKPQVHSFHLGADIGTAQRFRSESRQGSLWHFLMVSTVEPRKGYRQAIDAFRILRTRRSDVQLTIVGRKGWLVDDLAAEIIRETAHGRVTWYQNASDDELLSFYRSCDALISASEAEGFGLPLVEAALHGLPVIARDLPVFREITSNSAYFFEGLTGETLANAIEDWIELNEDGQAPLIDRNRLKSWAESADELMAILRQQSGSPDLADRARTVSVDEKRLTFPIVARQ